MIVLGRKGQILSTFTSVARIKVLHKLEFAKNLIQIKRCTKSAVHLFIRYLVYFCVICNVLSKPFLRNFTKGAIFS